MANAFEEKNLCAGVAQLVEQRIRNAKVGCSNPLTGTTNLSFARDANCLDSRIGVEAFFLLFVRNDLIFKEKNNIIALFHILATPIRRSGGLFP